MQSSTKHSGRIVIICGLRRGYGHGHAISPARSKCLLKVGHVESGANQSIDSSIRWMASRTVEAIAHGTAAVAMIWLSGTDATGPPQLTSCNLGGALLMDVASSAARGTPSSCPASESAQ
jgi:hypothetical protein